MSACSKALSVCVMVLMALAASAALLAILWFYGASSALAESYYTVESLGTLGGDNSVAVGINDSGHAVGTSGTAAGTQHAFLWKDGQMQDLGTLGGDYSGAYDVNDSNQVVGYSYTADGAQHAFLWENGQMRDLGTLGGDFSIAVGINNSGQVVGSSYTADGTQHAFLWENGQMRQLDIRYASDINDSGQVVGGQGGLTTQSKSAFVWENGQIQYLSGVGASYGYGINNLGQVVGHGLATGVPHAYLWDAPEGSDQVQDLGTLSGDSSSAEDVNDSGQVVGRSKFARWQSENHAFLWEGGQMSDLNDLISTDSSWILSHANGINNTGQIVGIGKIDGVTQPGHEHSFILTPGTRPPDTTNPTVDISLPADGATYLLNQGVYADYSCADEPGGWGLASCLAYGGNFNTQPVDTSSTGTHTFTVTATDNAGNTTTVTHTYEVVDRSSCGIEGTAGNDALEGTEGDDIICGLGGNDTITGLGGNDLLVGSDGNDRFSGGQGNDSLVGEAGYDFVSYKGSSAGIVASLVYGNATGEGADALAGIEHLQGSQLADTLGGSNDYNRLQGFGGNDTIVGLAGGDKLSGGANKDELDGGYGKDRIIGGTAGDKLYGDRGYDTLDSGDAVSGNDDLDGGADTDTCLTDPTEKSILRCEL